jgi:hypothetical protein
MLISFDLELRATFGFMHTSVITSVSSNKQVLENKSRVNWLSNYETQ